MESILMGVDVSWRSGHEVGSRDGDRHIDWGKTSADYATYRPSYPASFFARLEALGVGIAGQRVLDLATGTGILGRSLARRGCRVVGVDIAPEQIEACRRLAGEEGLELDLRVGPAEETGLAAASFDLVTASSCWLYFDLARMVPEVKRLLAPGGRLMTCHLSWLPREDPLARATEALILEHNPDWSAANFSGKIPAMPVWAEGHFDLAAMFHYDEALPFTRSTWRGRMRASRGIGATLNPDEIRRFDEEHARLLEEITEAEDFGVVHRIDAHIFAPTAG